MRDRSNLSPLMQRRLKRRFEAFTSANPVDVPVTPEMEANQRIAMNRFQNEDNQ